MKVHIRCFSLLLVLVMIFSCFTVSLTVSSADIPIYMTYYYNTARATELVSGRLRANIIILAFSEPLFVSLGYYNADGTLLDFSAKVMDPKTTSNPANIYITIPETVSDGQYVKLIAMHADTLQPISISNATLVCKDKFVTGVDTVYQGLSERYYTLDSPDGSISLNGSSVTMSDSGTPFRLKDMTDGEYAFESSINPRYRLTYDGSNLSRSIYLAGNASQRWKLESFGSGYAVANANGGYLAIENGAAIVRDEKYEWALTFAGETPFTLMTSLDGFKLLTPAQQQRIIDVCTSIGADVFPNAVSSGDSWLDKRESSFSDLYYSRFSKTAEEQRDTILDIMSVPLFSYLVDYYTMSSEFPGCATEITQEAPVKTKHIMWDLVEVDGEYFSDDGSNYIYDASKPINCYVIKVTYKNASSTQTVNLYCVDPDFENVQNTITAFGKFPYNYRKYIKNIYVYKPTNSASYNCGAEELFIRISSATEKTIMTGIAHELGHSADYNANRNPNNSTTHWCQGAAWQGHVANDLVTVSGYGNSNYYEGLAEFSRLYFFCYGNRDLQIGIEQLFPNQFGSFERMLTKLGGIDMY